MQNFARAMTHQMDTNAHCVAKAWNLYPAPLVFRGSEQRRIMCLKSSQPIILERTMDCIVAQAKSNDCVGPGIAQTSLFCTCLPPVLGQVLQCWLCSHSDW